MKHGTTLNLPYASLFHRFTDTNVCGTGSVKIQKTRHKISVNIQIFLIICYDNNNCFSSSIIDKSTQQQSPTPTVTRAERRLTMYILCVADTSRGRVRLHSFTAVWYNVRRNDAVWLGRRQPAQMYTITADDEPRQLTWCGRTCHQHSNPSTRIEQNKH